MKNIDQSQMKKELARELFMLLLDTRHYLTTANTLAKNQSKTVKPIETNK